MLNDLLTIERGLTAHGIDLVARHPDIKDMAKGRALLVRLRANGNIASVVDGALTLEYYLGMCAEMGRPNPPVILD